MAFEEVEKPKKCWVWRCKEDGVRVITLKPGTSVLICMNHFNKRNKSLYPGRDIMFLK